MAAHGKPKPKPPGAPAPPPPPPPPSAEARKSFMRRMFPFLLAANLFVGAYVVVRAYYKDSGKKDAQTDHPAAATVSTPSATAADKSPESAAAAPSKVFPPIPEDEQRQLYRWMLEEMRKVKPRDVAEKKKLDEEKALLKEIIRAECLPNL